MLYESFITHTFKKPIDNDVANVEYSPLIFDNKNCLIYRYLDNGEFEIEFVQNALWVISIVNHLSCYGVEHFLRNQILGIEHEIYKTTNNFCFHNQSQQCNILRIHINMSPLKVTIL